MKKYVAGLLLILVLVSCYTKREEEPPAEAISYISKPIGIDKNCEYSIIDADTITHRWNVDLKEKLQLPDMANLTDFKIVKTITQGDAQETCYLLLAHASDGSATVGSILYLEKNKFYFETDQRQGVKSNQIIICKGLEGLAGCSPVVVLNNKEKYLICSSSDECEKIVSEVY
jgi:hypothetical protein